MVTCCVAYNCKNRFDSKPKNVSFHRFPFSRPDILQQWIIAVQREGFRPNKSSRICSKHFAEDSYQYRPGAATLRLKEDAVPTIFSYPAYINKLIEKKKVLQKQNANKSKITKVTKNLKHPKHDFAEDNDFPQKENDASTNNKLLHMANVIKRKYLGSHKLKQQICLHKSNILQGLIEINSNEINTTKPYLSTQNSSILQRTKAIEIRLRKKVEFLQTSLENKKAKVCEMKALIKTLIKKRRLIYRTQTSTDHLHNDLKLLSDFSFVPTTNLPSIVIIKAVTDLD